MFENLHKHAHYSELLNQMKRAFYNESWIKDFVEDSELEYPVDIVLKNDILTKIFCNKQ